VYGTGSGSCPVAGFGISGVDPFGSAITLFVAWCNFLQKLAIAC
jgi:hypothetical protein